MKRASILLLPALALGAACAVGQEPVSQTIATAASGQVEVVNVSGSVRVVGWDRAEIRITGTVGPAVERVAVEGGRERTEIRVQIPRGRNVCQRNACDAELEVRVPAGKDVSVRATSADVELQGVEGTVAANSTSGDVRVGGAPRQVTAESTSGDVGVRAETRIVRASSTSGDVVVAGRAQTSVAVQSVSGDVTVSAETPELAAESVSGNLTVTGATRRASARTVSGDAVVRGARLQYLSLESVSGTLRYEGALLPAAAVKIESHSGDVHLLLPRDVSASFEVTTFSGDISNDFGAAARQTDRYTPSKELRFSTGNGGVVVVQTFSGNVRLDRR